MKNNMMKIESVKNKGYIKLLGYSKISVTLFIVGLILLLLGNFSNKSEAAVLSITACVLFLIAIVNNLKNINIEKYFDEDRFDS
jgi:hypothetical protein